MLRPTQLALRHLKSPVLRNTIQRRFASGGGPSTKLVGPMDNAFNRERLAVREHAAQSSGTQINPHTMQTYADCTFFRSLAKTLHLVKHRCSCEGAIPHLTMYSVVIPALLLASVNAKNLWDEHWEHWEHMPPLEERVEYPYQNIRTKAFFWGDGDKVSDSNFLGRANRQSSQADPVLES